MPGFLLTSATVANCPHGGAATFVPSQQRVQAGSSTVLVQSDNTFIAGCPFAIGPTPSPCLTVQWVTAAARVTVQSNPVLLSTSVGLCLNAASAPQGPIIIVATQTRVQAT